LDAIERLDILPIGRQGEAIVDDVHRVLSKLSTTKAGTFDAIVLNPEWQNEDSVAHMVHPMPGTIHYFFLMG